MIRKLDELGRISIPTEYRAHLNIHNGNEVDIKMNSSQIIIEKPIYGCHFCGVPEKLIKFRGTAICKNCIEQLNSAKDTQK